MKKLIILVLFFYPVFLFAQQQVTLKSGQQFNGNIMGVRGDNLRFYQKISEIDSKEVDIILINSIAGEIDKSTKKALIKRNPEINFEATFRATENEISYQPFNQGKTSELKAGDHLVTAGTRYLTGVTLAIVGSTISVVGGVNETRELSIAGGVIAIVGGVISISGHFQLIKAGKIGRAHV